MTRTAAMLESWAADIAVLAPDAGPRQWWAEGELLLAGWGEPHRRYHTLEHLAEVFQALAELERAGDLPPAAAAAARVAGWYHDLAYDPRALPGSNEHRSASIARDHLHRLGADDEAVDTVEELVLLTADHRSAGRPGEVPATRRAVRAAFHDADLWILGAPPERFDRYCAQVRAEYAHVPDQPYAVARSAILRSLTGRAPVYRTAHARAHWEQRALRNVERELARLAA